MIILDTHVIIWLTSDLQKLGKITQNLITQHYHNKQISYCAFSLWEIEMLIQKQRINMAIDTYQFRQDLLNYGLQEIKVDGRIGILSNQLNLHGDPADRIIVATAITYNAKLITADSKILDWQHPFYQLNKHNAKL